MPVRYETRPMLQAVQGRRALLLMAAFAFSGAEFAVAASRVASVSGNWNSTATWGGLSVPVLGDTVTNNAGVTVTVPTAYTAQCATLVFTTNSGASSIVLADSTSALSVTGAVTIQRNGSAVNKIDVGAGAFSAGSVVLSGTTGGAQLSQLLISTGTASISGNVTSAGVDSQIIFSGLGTLNAGGTFLSGTAGTFTPSTGTVNYNGAAQTVGVYNYNHLTLSGSGAKTMTSITNLTGNLTMSGAATATTATNLAIGGNLAVWSNTTLTVGGFTFAVAGTTSVSGTLAHNNNTGLKTYVGDVTINSGGIWNETTAAIGFSFAGSLQNDGTLTVIANSNGVHTFTGAGKTLSGANAIILPRVTLDGSYSNAGTLIVSNSLAGAGALTQGAGATLSLGGPTNTAIPLATLNASANPNTVNYGGTAQTVKPVAYHHLTLSGSGAKNLTDVTTLGGDFTVAGSATLLSNAVLAVSGVFNYGSSGTSILTNNVNAGSLTMGAGTLNLGTNLTHVFTGAWTRTAGTLNGGSSLLKIGGNVSGAGGTFTAGTGTLEWNGAGDQTLAAVTYNHLILSGVGAKFIGAGSIATGNVSIATGTKANLEAGLNLSVGMLTLGGVGKNKGTWGSSSSSVTYTNDVFFSLTTGYLTVTTDTRSDTVTWRGTGDWFADTGNWSNGVPGPGSNVWIASGTVTLTNVSPLLAEIIIGAPGVSAGTSLVFTNWSTYLAASNVTVLSNGVMTLPAAFTTSQMSNRVWVACTNFALEKGGQILADVRGFAGRNGPGKGADGSVNQAGGGGAYGGKGGGWGGVVAGGSPYGSTNAPLDPGSGGGSGNNVVYVGGNGGGAVRIDAFGGVVTIDGTVSANGGAGGVHSYGGGSGSGGAIYITCATFAGSSNGLLRANGVPPTNGGGAGGGGRIAVNCANMVRENVNVRFEAAGGTTACGMGTLYLSDTNLLSETLTQFNNLRIVIPGFTAWQVPYLAISNRVVALEALARDAFTLVVASDLTITNGGLSVGGQPVSKGVSDNLSGTATNPSVTVGGALRLTGGSMLRVGVNGSNSPVRLTVSNDVWVADSGSSLIVGGTNQIPQTLASIGGALILTNSGSLWIYSGKTNGIASTNYGALVAITGAVAVGAGSWIYPFSQSTDGGSVKMQAASLSVLSGGGINADSRGYNYATGPGKGGNAAVNKSSGGGGYGGKGGAGTDGAGGNPYGSTNVPLGPGSGGGIANGGNING
ncbi:MAG: hypothetical protein WCL16_11030, partial [bacterium]